MVVDIQQLRSYTIYYELTGKLNRVDNICKSSIIQAGT